MRTRPNQWSVFHPARNTSDRPNLSLHQVPPGQLLDHDAVMASEPTLSTLALQADASSSSYAFQQNAAAEGAFDSAAPLIGRTKEQIRKYYLKALHKVVDESDIVILVLDARDPEGCRSRLVEEEVRRREAEGKKLVFVLNKIGMLQSFLTYICFLCAGLDLVPRANAQAWLKYLRHSTPTLPFLSSAASQHQRTNISSTTAPALLKLLKAYKPKAGSITVGVVGYPNVGKSSLINSLKRSKVSSSSFLICHILHLLGLPCCCTTGFHQGAAIYTTGARDADS